MATLILPSGSDDTIMKQNFVVLVSRVIADNMQFFNTSFSDVVDRHICHQYSEEMSKKSEVVSTLMYISNSIHQILLFISQGSSWCNSKK